MPQYTLSSFNDNQSEVLVKNSQIKYVFSDLPIFSSNKVNKINLKYENEIAPIINISNKNSKIRTNICLHEINDAPPIISIQSKVNKRHTNICLHEINDAPPTISIQNNDKKNRYNVIIKIQDINEKPTINIPYKKHNRYNFHIQEIGESDSFEKPTISISKKEYYILRELEMLIKNKITPDFVTPYNNYNYNKVKKNIDNKLLNKYLCIVKNKKYKNISTAFIIKETLELICNGLKQNTEINNLNDVIINLNKKINELEETIMSISDKKTSFFNINTELSVNVKINDKYLIYICKFGMPENGIFDQYKLFECELECDSDDD